MPTLEETARQLLAIPREAGTDEATAARELVTAHLKSLGYRVVLQKFRFAPSSLRAFPLFGESLGLLALFLFPLLGSAAVPRWAALVVWLGGLVATGVIAAGVGLGWVSLGEPMREDGNLMASRGEPRPRRWIVAHLDSKAQGHSMAGRLVALWTSIVAIGLLTVLAALRLASPVATVWIALATGTALIAGFLARKGRLRGRSQGARDNGTGVVAALAAAEAVPGTGLGILITGAEEFGLVGARVFARITPELREMEFVNVDTVDQEGFLYLVSHDARGERLGAEIEPALQRLELPLKHRRLPLGILVDSAPLARAGAPSVTLGRLTWNTLRRIHTPADTISDLSLDTAVRLGKAIARASIDVSAEAR